MLPASSQRQVGLRTELYVALQPRREPTRDADFSISARCPQACRHELCKPVYTNVRRLVALVVSKLSYNIYKGCVGTTAAVSFASDTQLLSELRS